MLVVEEWQGICPSRVGDAMQILRGFIRSEVVDSGNPSAVFGRKTAIVFLVADADHKYNISKNADTSDTSQNRTILAGQYRLEGVVGGWNLAVL